MSKYIISQTAGCNCSEKFCAPGMEFVTAVSLPKFRIEQKVTKNLQNQTRFDLKMLTLLSKKSSRFWSNTALPRELLQAGAQWSAALAMSQSRMRCWMLQLQPRMKCWMLQAPRSSLSTSDFLAHTCACMCACVCYSPSPWSKTKQPHYVRDAVVPDCAL